MKVGDLVAIRGDKRLNTEGKCCYLPEQLVRGKWLKHSGHGGIWLGTVRKIQGDMALVGGGWYKVDNLDVMMRDMSGLLGDLLTDNKEARHEKTYCT